MLRGDREIAAPAARISAMTRDLSELVTELGLTVDRPPALLTVAYHSACSLQHGQKITAEPKALLAAAGFTVRDIPEGHLCCGSAGTYSLLQPALAQQLRRGKLDALAGGGPGVIASPRIWVADVRRGLMAAGFTVEKVAGFASKHDMLRGSLNQPPHAPDHAPWFAVPENNYKTKKMAVIGAGIAGITTAWSLGRKGWQVDLYDSQPDFALSGSGNPAGVLLPRIAAVNSSESEFYAAAFLMALRRLSQLKDNYPELVWEQSGGIQLLSSDRLRNQHDHLELAKEYVRSLSAGEAAEVAGIQLDDGLLFPLAGWRAPRSLCDVLLQDVRNAVNTRFNVEVTRLERQTDSWLLRDKHHAVLGNYEVIVLANAQSVVQFEQTTWLNVQPARGQISYLPQSAISQDLKCPVCYDGYVLPAFNGCHVRIVPTPAREYPEKAKLR